LLTQIKVFIHTEFAEGPWGGGNQFLKALKNEFRKRNCYTENPKKAGVILFNSHHYLDEIICLRRKFKDKLFVHRVDGPMAYRGKSGEELDKDVFKVNFLVADGTVFQSEWSRRECYRKGMKKNSLEAVIHNASDPELFFPLPKKEPAGEKIKLISTSWSNNPDKGFDIYHYLDEKLNFENYDMTFVGRPDGQFSNIRMISPVSSKDLAEHLRQEDIFVFASKFEACSNSLVEALTCGIPAVVRNTSSNPEILGERGLTFHGKEDIIMKIKAVANRLDDYRSKQAVAGIEVIAEEYCQFFEELF
jgi:glycosyltransferase involved in cell wall biosynthesis